MRSFTAREWMLLIVLIALLAACGGSPTPTSAPLGIAPMATPLPPTPAPPMATPLPPTPTPTASANPLEALTKTIRAWSSVKTFRARFTEPPIPPDQGQLFGSGVESIEWVADAAGVA